MGEEFQTMTERLDRIERLSLIAAKPVLLVEEAAIFTGFSVQHLYRLTSAKQIPHYKKDRKLYFKKSELEEWMLEHRVQTNEEIERQKLLIRQAFERGERLTTFTGNQIGHTVDFRKVVSELRDEGFLIKDYWEKASDGRKFKVYYHENATPEAVRGQNN